MWAKEVGSVTKGPEKGSGGVRVKSVSSVQGKPVSGSGKKSSEAVRKALEEISKERAEARRRAKLCVTWTYFVLKGAGVATMVFTAGINIWIIAKWGQLNPHGGGAVREKLVRSYLVIFCIAATLAELDTPFARDNFRALQKWWFKGLFYVFLAVLNFGWSNGSSDIRYILEMTCMVALVALAIGNFILNVCLRRMLERTVLKKKRRATPTSSRKRQRPPLTSSASTYGAIGGRSARHERGTSAGSSPVNGFAAPERVPEQPRLQMPPSKRDTVRWWLDGGGNNNTRDDDETASAAGGSGDGGASRVSQGSRWWEDDAAGTERGWATDDDASVVSELTSASGMQPDRHERDNRSYVGSVAGAGGGIPFSSVSSQQGGTGAAGDNVNTNNAGNGWPIPTVLSTLEERPPPLSPDKTETSDIEEASGSRVALLPPPPIVNARQDFRSSRNQQSLRYSQGGPPSVRSVSGRHYADVPTSEQQQDVEAQQNLGWETRSQPGRLSSGAGGNPSRSRRVIDNPF